MSNFKKQIIMVYIQNIIIINNNFKCFPSKVSIVFSAPGGFIQTLMDLRLKICCWIEEKMAVSWSGQVSSSLGTMHSLSGLQLNLMFLIIISSSTIILTQLTFICFYRFFRHVLIWYHLHFRDNSTVLKHCGS